MSSAGDKSIARDGGALDLSGIVVEEEWREIVKVGKPGMLLMLALLLYLLVLTQLLLQFAFPIRFLCSFGADGFP